MTYEAQTLVRDLRHHGAIVGLDWADVKQWPMIVIRGRVPVSLAERVHAIDRADLADAIYHHEERDAIQAEHPRGSGAGPPGGGASNG